MAKSSKLREKVLSPSIPGRFILDMVEGYRHRGGNVDELLEKQGLSRGHLAIAGYRVSVDTYVSLLRQISEELQDEALGFLEKPLPLRSYAVFCSGLTGKQSLAEVMVFYRRFYGLFTEQFSYVGEETEEGYVISVDLEETAPMDYRFLYHSLLLSLVRLVGWLIGIKLVPLSVSLSHAQRDYEEHLQYLFDCPIQYGQPKNCVVIPKEYLQAPIGVTMDLVDLMLQESRFTLLVTERGSPFSQAVKKHLMLSKHHEWPEIQSVAEGMKLSPNLLWRKLKKEGTTFSKIRDELKRDWALQMVQDPALSVEDIAETLRFSDVRGLQKAFQKWTGISVGEYRQRLLST